MRKIIIILIASILGLEITSCANVGRKAFQEAAEEGTEAAARRKVFQEAAEEGTEAAARRKVFQEAAEEGTEAAARRKAFQKEAQEAALRKAALRKATLRKYAQRVRLKQEIYDVAYTDALRYYESEGSQASQIIANKIAVKAASEKNRELGEVVGDATVMTIAGSAATAAAATHYQENNQD